MREQLIAEMRRAYDALGEPESWQFDPQNSGRSSWWGYGLVSPDGPFAPVGIHIEVSDYREPEAAEARAKAIAGWIAAAHNAMPEILATEDALRRQCARLAEVGAAALEVLETFEDIMHEEHRETIALRAALAGVEAGGQKAAEEDTDA